MTHCCEQNHNKHDGPATAKAMAGKHTPEMPAHRSHSAGEFSRKFWLSLVLTLPVVIYSDLPKVIFGWKAPTFGIWNLNFGIFLIIGYWDLEFTLFW